MIRKLWMSAAALLTAFALFAAVAVWKAARAARIATASVAASRTSSFTSRMLDRALPAIEPVGAPSAFTDVALFDGGTLVSTPSALVEYDSAGSVRHRWRMTSPALRNCCDACSWLPTSRSTILYPPPTCWSSTAAVAMP